MHPSIGQLNGGKFICYYVCLWQTNQGWEAQSGRRACLQS